ncbi:MAG: hypothetical protein HY885_08675 [Deltaproteobacteria bacterium]|nr:hypothetical protein [Deltaproteobacteria bacterium]
MLQFLKKLAGVNVFPMLCYLLAAYFLYAFCLVVGVPPSKPLSATSGSYLALALFLFMLPESKKLKLGRLFEYEARVKEIKEEVKQFKDETRTTLAAYTNLVSAISNTVSQTINVNLPSRAEASQANEELDTTLKTKTAQTEIEEQIENFLVSEGNDLNYALAKLRMQLEKELRRILGKRLGTVSHIGEGTRFLSARSLFLQFIRQHPDYEGISSSFDYILKVCNAAIHGQYVSEGYAHEALTMGFRMLAELKNINVQEF